MKIQFNKISRMLSFINNIFTTIMHINLQIVVSRLSTKNGIIGYLSGKPTKIKIQTKNSLCHGFAKSLQLIIRTKVFLFQFSGFQKGYIYRQIDRQIYFKELLSNQYSKQKTKQGLYRLNISPRRYKILILRRTR